MRFYRVLTLLISVSLPAIAAAQVSTYESQFYPNTQTYRVNLTPEQATASKLIFWYKSKGNSSVPVDFYVEAPAGVRVKLKGAFFASKVTPSTLISDTRAWSTVKFKGSTGGLRTSYVFPTIAQGATAAPKTAAGRFANLDCASMSSQNIDAILQSLRITDPTLTRADICLDPNATPTPTPGTTTQSDPTISSAIFSAIFSKDACEPASGASYMVGFEYDLRGVSPEIKAKGFSLATAAQERPWPGSKAGTIKPVSEGQFAPRPLVLMSSVGGFGSAEKINVRQYAKRKPKWTKTLSVVKYVYYRGLVLSTALVGPVLTGGRGSFELTNGSNAYSACFSLTRTRQRVNGYRN